MPRALSIAPPKLGTYVEAHAFVLPPAEWIRVGALTVPLPPVGRGWGELLYLDDELRVQRDVRGDVIIARKVGAA